VEGDVDISKTSDEGSSFLKKEDSPGDNIEFFDKIVAFINKLSSQGFEIDIHLFFLIGIILTALAVRLYFFLQYGGQALWYDEADYLLRAKSIAFNLDWAQLAERKPVLLPFVWSIILFFGGNEMIIKLSVVLMSVGCVYVLYLLGKEAYNTMVGLFMALFFGVFYLSLFHSIRVLLDHGALLATLISVLFFIKWYKDNRARDILIAAVAASLAIQVFFVPLYLVYLFAVFLAFMRPLEFYKDKAILKAILTLALVFLPMIIFWYVNYGDPFFGFSQYFGTGNPNPDAQHNGILGMIMVIPSALFTPLLMVFLIGLIKTIADIYLNFNQILHRKNKNYDIDIFFLFWLLLVVTALGVVFLQVEPRYMFPGMIPAYYFAAMGLYFLWIILKKYSKPIATIMLIIFLAYVSHSHIVAGNQLIEYKSTSFQQEKFAGYWLEENLEKDEIFLSCNQVAVLEAYSGRQAYGFGINTTKAEEHIELHHPKYLVIDGYYGDCAVDYPGNNLDTFKLVQAYFVDETRTQPIVLIYEVIY
jgi:4-amino-4-deoxy-L-arabinose transferase-like glycosyltransferase